MDSPDRLRSLETKIMDALAELGPSDYMRVARRLNIGPARSLGILRSLATRGLIVKDTHTGYYRPTSRFH